VAKLILPEGSAARGLIYRLRGRLGLDLIGVGAPRVPDFVQEGLEPFARWLKAKAPQGLLVILAPTQFREDEGQRSTHIALEFARRGFAVLFGYWRWDRRQWARQDMLDRGIFQWPVDMIARWPDTVFRAHSAPLRLALFEFPHPSFFRALGEANGSGWITIYDVVDHWEDFERVGQAPWYDRAFEEHLLAGADAVLAVSERLRSRVEAMGRGGAMVIPNAYAPGLGEAAPAGRRHADLTLGYFGYLAGAWFDWPLVAQVGRARPEWRIELIGYGGGPGRVKLLSNVVLLGQQPRRELASLASGWDVAMVPFIERPLSEAADPIKVYEYLALGLPVVVTGVHPPRGAEQWVRRASGVQEFIGAVERAAGSADREARRAFARDNLWARRADALLEMVHKGRQGIGWKKALFERRP
jgi:glycosyltransferase involved in cell wall biosynthesis